MPPRPCSPCSGAWPALPRMRPRPDGALRAGAALSPVLLLLLPLLGHLRAASTPGPSSSSPGTQQDNQLGSGRVKRGWVWNQFFVVEEYTGTEPLYVGKVKWDPLSSPSSGDTHWKSPSPLPSSYPIACTMYSPQRPACGGGAGGRWGIQQVRRSDRAPPLS